MKSLILVISFLLLSSCSVELVDSWKNPEISTYYPSKVLIIGMTSNITARQEFENQLKGTFELRGSEAITSMVFFDPSMITEKIDEAQMDDLEAKLLDEGFDTILFTKVIGVDDKIRYKQDYDGFDSTYKKFKEEYLMYQDIYYNPDYYENFKLYHTETSMYCICPGKERALIWKAYIDITDPKNVQGIITEYVNLIIIALEEEQLITPLNQEETGDIAI
ncbi:hypothetical protein [Confluentibacter lentus]|uniref:hypothetical protein n=1 Tax=Confluentibacter lentus TaxID=1699412 RepID=UPI000C287A06|nr:hypothetical protein [Confluentibacter lentus]